MLEFSDLLKEIPSIRGVTIENLLPDYDGVSMGARDFWEIGDANATTAFISSVYDQGPEISKYEHFLKTERRKLIQNQILSYINDIDNILKPINLELNDDNFRNPSDPEIISNLNEKVMQIDVLMGDSVQRPSKWTDLERHLYFGQLHDLEDIISIDWPSIKPELEEAFRGDYPFKINTEDIGDLVDNAKKSGKIGTKLNWSSITYANFERLCADLLEVSPNWENVEWLTPTNASDRGRDIAAFWVSNDATRGTIREKAIIQCKHRPDKSVSPKDIESFQNLSLLHGNVDLYILITSGKFTDQVVQIVEKQNERGNKPKVEIWEHWKLEKLLTSHPHLITMYGLQ